MATLASGSGLEASKTLSLRTAAASLAFVVESAILRQSKIRKKQSNQHAPSFSRDQGK